MYISSRRHFPWVLQFNPTQVWSAFAKWFFMYRCNHIFQAREDSPVFVNLCLDISARGFCVLVCPNMSRYHVWEVKYTPYSLKKRWLLILFTVQLLISNHQALKKKGSIWLTETACVRLPAANFGYKWSATGVRQTPCLEGGISARSDVVKPGAWLSELGTSKNQRKKNKHLAPEIFTCGCWDAIIYAFYVGIHPYIRICTYI